METTTPQVPDERIRPTVSVREAARWLDVADSTAYAMAHSGELPVIRAGGRLLVPTAALRRLLGLPLASETEPAA